MKDNSRTNLISAFLRRLARDLEQLSDADLRRLLDSRGAILATSKSGARAGGNTFKADVSKDELETLKRRLEQASSREEAHSLITASLTTRDQFVVLARFLDIPASKRYNVPQLVERIIEATIGYRKRSAAIRGAD